MALLDKLKDVFSKTPRCVACDKPLKKPVPLQCPECESVCCKECAVHGPERVEPGTIHMTPGGIYERQLWETFDWQCPSCKATLVDGTSGELAHGDRKPRVERY